MRNTNWFMWIIMFSIGMSVAGGAAAVLGTFLGFPYTWVYPLSLVMFGAVAWLVYRGYPLHAWLLTGCVGFILLSGVALLRGVTVSDPNIPETYRVEFEAAHVGESIFGVVVPFFSGYYGDYFVEYKPDRDTYLIEPGYDMRTMITIKMPPIQTAGGQWAFVAGTLSARGAMSGTFTAGAENNWYTVDEIEFNPDLSARTVHPELSVMVPLPRGPRGTIQADVTLEMVYPQDGEIIEDTLTRSMTLEVINYDTYYSYESRYLNWKRSRSIIETPIWMLLVVGSVVAGAGAVYLVREGDLHPTGAGGLQMVVRRLSGSQKIGAEFLDLEAFRNRTTATQGVFVGRVTAQSPAGRAGLRTGDVLIELDGKPVNAPGPVKRLAKSKNKGDRVTAVVLRDDARVELLIRF